MFAGDTNYKKLPRGDMIRSLLKLKKESEMYLLCIDKINKVESSELSYFFADAFSYAERFIELVEGHLNSLSRDKPNSFLINNLIEIGTLASKGNKDIGLLWNRIAPDAELYGTPHEALYAITRDYFVEISELVYLGQELKNRYFENGNPTYESENIKYHYPTTDEVIDFLAQHNNYLKTTRIGELIINHSNVQEQEIEHVYVILMKLNKDGYTNIKNEDQGVYDSEFYSNSKQIDSFYAEEKPHGEQKEVKTSQVINITARDGAQFNTGLGEFNNTKSTTREKTLWVQSFVIGVVVILVATGIIFLTKNFQGLVY